MSDAGNTTAHIHAALALLPVDPNRARDLLLAHTRDRMMRMASLALNYRQPLRDRGVQTDDIVQSVYVRLLTGWNKVVADKGGLPLSDSAAFLRRLSFHLRGVLGDELRRIVGRPPESRTKKPPPDEPKQGEAGTGECTAIVPAEASAGTPTAPAKDATANTPTLGMEASTDAAQKPAGKRRPKTQSLNRLGEPGGGYDAGTDTLDPERLAMFTEFHQAVDELPDSLRAVVDLHYYQELTHAQVDTQLGLERGTSQRYWVKARLMLIKRLGANPFLDSEG